MRIVLVGSLWLLSAVAAADTLRVGDHLLVSGDSAAQVRAALGRPSRVTHHRDRDRAARHRRGAAKKPASESWIYRRDGREITVTLVGGAVTTIEQRP